MKNEITLTRAAKILLVLYELSQGKSTAIRYEDIVVRVFKKYPTDFHLKGYPEYPESGDLVHKPLYDFKKKGLLTAGNKMFSLTEKGVVAAEQLSLVIRGKSVSSTTRLSRDIEREIDRIVALASFKIFIAGDIARILDTDFYQFLGITVRTPRNDVLGRLNTIRDVLKTVKPFEQKDPLYKELRRYCSFMLTKFLEITEYMSTH